jgi:hypothetical protein
MKNNIIWFALMFTFVNQLFSQQSLISVKNNQHQFFNKTVSFNPSVEKYYRVMECELNKLYSQKELDKILIKLKNKFPESKLIQSGNSNKIVFITNKMALVETNGSIQEYIKSVLVELNLYNGFTEIKEYNLELD